MAAETALPIGVNGAWGSGPLGIIDAMALPAPSHKTHLFFVRLLTGWTLREIAELLPATA